MHIRRAWRVPQGDFNSWLPAMRQRLLFSTGLWVLQHEMGFPDLQSYDPNEQQPTRRTWHRLVLNANSMDPYADKVIVSLSIWYHRAHFYVKAEGRPEVIDKVVGGAEEYGWWLGNPPEGILASEWDRRHALWSVLLGERGAEVMTHSVFDPRTTTESDFRWWAKELSR